MDGGEAIRTYISELRDVVKDVSQSNRSDLAGLAENLTAALDDYAETTEFMLRQLEAGETQTALAGATPYQHLAGLAAGAVYLAKAALVEGTTGNDARASIAQFMASNLLNETTSLRNTVENGAESLLGAGAHLLTA